jgi:hypothetical protein
MRGLFIILVLLTFGCSSDSDDCYGTAKYMTDSGDFFYIENNPKDCDTGQPTELSPSGWFVGWVN